MRRERELLCIDRLLCAWRKQLLTIQIDASCAGQHGPNTKAKGKPKTSLGHRSKGKQWQDNKSFRERKVLLSIVVVCIIKLTGG